MRGRKIPLLRKPGIEFRAGQEGYNVTYTPEFLKEQLDKIDKNVYLYTDYCSKLSTDSDKNLYIMKIFTDSILQSVYKNKHYSEDPALRIKRYDPESNTILCSIDEKTHSGHDILEVLDNDKVYISFVISYDRNNNTIELDRAVLCLGIVGNHILFI